MKSSASSSSSSSPELHSLSARTAVGVPAVAGMKSCLSCTLLLLSPVALHWALAPGLASAAVTSKCDSIYKGFAQCLLALGDSMSQSVQGDQGTKDIDSICRFWEEFHTCANTVLEGCPEEAAAVWESLRQESRKMQFSGNLHDLCTNRVKLSPGAQSPPSQEQTNQASLRASGHVFNPVPLLLIPASLLRHWV